MTKVREELPLRGAARPGAGCLTSGFVEGIARVSGTSAASGLVFRVLPPLVGVSSGHVFLQFSCPFIAPEAALGFILLPVECRVAERRYPARSA